MAQIKKNQMANIVFPMVDGVDFASVESGLTASDFESKITKKFFGVTHGNSTAFTSGTISKTIQLVRSGIFQQTLKAAETNYDYVLYSFAPANTSLAHQMLVFQPVDYDDSDMFSQLSDIGSNLLSYLTGMSGMLSDVQSALDSQFLVVTSDLSDIDSQLLLNASVISDIQSALDSQFVWTSNFLSDMNSDLSSQIGGITATISASDISDITSAVWGYPLASRTVVASVSASDMSDLRSAITAGPTVSASDISDIASAVWAAKYTAHSAASSFGSLMSDVYSRLVLTQSNVSDIQSALDSQFTWTSNFLSDMNSDLSSQIGGITASVTASDMSDIASRVWATAEGTRVDSRILVIQSLVSDVDSQLLLNASVISDIQSALDSQFVYLSNAISDMHSDLGSQIGGITASVTASDMSDIASRVWATAEGTRVDSRILVIQSLVSDVDSQLLLNASVISDIQSALDSQFVWTSNFLSDMNSDLSSQIGGITATVSASDISDIASAVWGAKYTGHSVASSFGSLVSDIYSRLALTQSNVSDIQSALDSQFVWTSNFLSDMNSDLSSQIGGITASVTASDMSDIASRVWATAEGTRVDSRILVIQSLVSDVDSQLLLNASVISDIQSALDSQFVWTSNFLSDMNSDLSSQIGGITATISASDISDIASAVWGAKYTAHSAASSFGSLVSDIYSLLSDVDSQLLLNASVISDVQSAIDSQFVYLSNAISDMHSDLGSQIGGITASVTASDMSDIASRVWATAEGTRVDSRILVIQSLVSDVDSQLLLNASVISDIQSALDSQFVWTSNFLSDMNSDLSSQIGGITATISASDISDITSAVWGYPFASKLVLASLSASDMSDLRSAISAGPAATVTPSDISDIASAVWANTIGTRVDSRILLIQSNISDVESQLDVTHSSVSDIYSLLSDVDSQLTVTHSLVSDIDSQLLLNASVISDVQSAVTALNDIAASDVLSAALTEAYATDGSAFTLAQALYMIWSALSEFSISGTTITCKKLDGSTTAMTFTLDDGTDPTSRTRAT